MMQISRVLAALSVWRRILLVRGQRVTALTPFALFAFGALVAGGIAFVHRTLEEQTVVPQLAVTPPLTDPISPRFYDWARTPPMGWNSWDCFGAGVTEEQVRAHADYMAEHLARLGWEYVVVDIQWYEPEAYGHDYRKGAVLTMDEFGRLLPAPNRFPSAAEGGGFKALADYVHAKGLKFGVHLLRGIPRQAVAQNTPIKGTNFRAADVANTSAICTWNTDMYGVDMSKPGAQEYYNSVFELFAEWGVDFVKVDDISHPHAPPDGPYHAAEVEGIRNAIDRSGRPIVLSLSPGKTPMRAAEHVSRLANMWRVAEDLWDEWPAVKHNFRFFDRWNEFMGEGHFPDGDMLPLGVIRMGRPTALTPDEQRTLLTLWCMARSPLMYGGDLTRMDSFTLSLLTNEEVIAVNQASSGNRQLFDRDDLIGWAADVPDSADKYVALFNARDRPERDTSAAGTRVRLNLEELGEPRRYLVRDLWARQDLGVFEREFVREIPWHGAELFRFSPLPSESEGSFSR